MPRKTPSPQPPVSPDRGVIELLKAIGLSAVTVAPGVLALQAGKKQAA